MMFWDDCSVPCADWVEIIHVTNKDGSELDEDNWRRHLFGRITLCWIAGGIRKRAAFFQGKIRIQDGKFTEFNALYRGNCSTTKAHPIEVEPGVYDLETNTSIYRFRILSEDEEQAVLDALREDAERKMATFSPPANKGFPAS